MAPVLLAGSEGFWHHTMYTYAKRSQNLQEVQEGQGGLLAQANHVVPARRKDEEGWNLAGGVACLSDLYSLRPVP